MCVCVIRGGKEAGGKRSKEVELYLAYTATTSFHEALENSVSSKKRKEKEKEKEKREGGRK